MGSIGIPGILLVEILNGLVELGKVLGDILELVLVRLENHLLLGLAKGWLRLPGRVAALDILGNLLQGQGGHGGAGSHFHEFGGRGDPHLGLGDRGQDFLGKDVREIKVEELIPSNSLIRIVFETPFNQGFCLRSKSLNMRKKTPLLIMDFLHQNIHIIFHVGTSTVYHGI